MLDWTYLVIWEAWDMFHRHYHTESEWHERAEISEEKYKQFRRVVDTVSSILPKVSDASLFEIDDILYPNYEEFRLSQCKTITLHEETLRDFTKDIQHRFLRQCLIDAGIEMMDPSLDMAILQSIENFTSETINYFGYEILDYVQNLVITRNIKKICTAVKIFKMVASNIDDDFMKKKLCRDIASGVEPIIHAILWMSNLPNIPQAKSVEKKRITSFISHQTTAIFEKLDIKSKGLKTKHLRAYFDVYNLEDLEVKKDEDYIRNLIKATYWNYFRITVINPNRFHHYFMTAKNDEKKFDRLRNFISVLYKPCSGHWISSKPYLLYECFSRFLKCFLENYEYSNERLRKIDQYYTYDITSYLPKYSATNSNIKHSQNQYTHDMIPFEEEDILDDLILDKFLIYDEFMRCLHVISIIYDACIRYKDITELEEEAMNFEANLFMAAWFNIRTYLTDILKDKTKRGNVSWFMETIINKCPFMILNPHQYILIDDLVKIIRGEAIDEVTEENLYFAIDTFSDF